MKLGAPRRPPARRPGLRLLATGLALIAIVFGCMTSDGPRGPALRVGVSPDAPPVVFERDGEIVGIEADLARLVGLSLDRRVVFHRASNPELLEAVERGEIDVVMSGVAITPEWAERVRFTQPYMQVGQLLMIRASDVARFGRVEGVRRRGARVGYERGTRGEQFVANQLVASRSFAFDQLDEALRSLRAGRIDYLIHDAPTIWRLAGDPRLPDLMGLYQPLTEESLAWAVAPDDEALHARLDALLSRWKREGRIEPILDRWIPVRVTVR